MKKASGLMLIVAALVVIAFTGCSVSGTPIIVVRGPTSPGGPVEVLPSGSLIEFGDELELETYSVTLTIENAGTEDLFFSESGPNYIAVAGDIFTFAVDTQPTSDTLAPGETVSVVVSYEALNYCDSNEAFIVIASSDSAVASYTLELHAGSVCP